MSFEEGHSSTIHALQRVKLENVSSSSPLVCNTQISLQSISSTQKIMSLVEESTSFEKKLFCLLLSASMQNSLHLLLAYGRSSTNASSNSPMQG